MPWTAISTVEIWNQVPRGRGWGITVVGELEQTSTGTIRPNSTSNDTVMYGLDPRAVTNSLIRNSPPWNAGFTSASQFLRTSPCASSFDERAYITRINGDYGAFGEVQIWPRRIVGDGPLLQTCVPWEDDSDLIASNWTPMVQVNYGTSPYTYTILDTTSTTDQRAFGVIYKDPSVVYLGGTIRKWVMLVTRIRVLNTHSGAWAGGSNPSGSISDIVAFTCDDHLFSTSDVEGPFWIVSDLDALPDVDVRTWVGVPDGFYRQDPDTGVEYLYVYYMVNEVDGTSGDDTPDAGTNPGFTAPQRPCIGCRRVEASEFQTTPADPHVWESVEENDPDYLMAGELVGEVRVWLAEQGGTYGEVVPFAEAFPYPILADPAVTLTADVPTSDGGTQNVHSLWFSAIAYRSALGSGYGVWRASAVADGSTLTDTTTGDTVIATFGRDFVSRVELDAGVYAPGLDLIVESDLTDALAVDPDPVGLAIPPMFRVYVGMLDATSGVAETMVVVEGELGDVIVWTDAW